MRNPIILSTLILAVLLAAPMAQTPPQAISYQALIRDGAGAPLRNQAVRLRIRLHQDSAMALIAYAETFNPTTNGFGNVNLAIGLGTVVSGTFSTLDWSRPMYVEIGVDPNGGTAYVDLGTAQLLSVPYAMYAGGSVGAGDITSVAAGPGLSGGGASGAVALAADMAVVQSRVTNGCAAGSAIRAIASDGSVTCISTSTGTPSEIRDADGNTRVSTERSPNENVIRFDLSGTEKMRLRGNALEFPNTGLSVYIGDSAGANVLAGDRYNVFVGDHAGRSNTAGYANTFSGYYAGRSNITGYGNTFSGYYAGQSNTTGYANTFSGNQAGYSNTTGLANTFSGYQAGYFNTTGNSNTFSGYGTGFSNITGLANTFSGYAAGFSNTTGNLNTFSGYYAGYANTTGPGNTFTGIYSGFGNTTGDHNVFLGDSAGYGNVSGKRNIYIGYASYAAGGDSNNIYIGTGTGISLGGRVIQSNKLIIDNRDPLSPLIFGDFATDSLRINGGLWVARSITATAFNVSSDRRLKENIQPVSNALDGVGKINGVYYTYKAKAPDGNPYPQSRQIGVIAQDVEKVYPELVATQPGGYKAVDYPKLTAVLIEAVKEQQKIIESLKAGNASMATRMEKVEAALRLSQLERDAAKVAKR